MVEVRTQDNKATKTMTFLKCLHDSSLFIALVDLNTLIFVFTLAVKNTHLLATVPLKYMPSEGFEFNKVASWALVFKL